MQAGHQPHCLLCGSRSGKPTHEPVNSASFLSSGTAGSIALSATTGTFRLLADRHHATDIVVGALVGFGFGYGMPTLLHYSQRSKDERRLGLALTPLDRGFALSAAGEL